MLSLVLRREYVVRRRQQVEVEDRSTVEIILVLPEIPAAARAAARQAPSAATT